MGIRERWNNLWRSTMQELEPARRLNLQTGFNVRELGGYAVGEGSTQYRRFVRSGGLDMLSAQDQLRLHGYGVRMVVDLRGDSEVRLARDKLAEMPGVRFCHVPLYDINISDPQLERSDDDGSYMTLGYLTMLGNHEAIRRIFSFFATAGEGDCVLFHCAAGMDRTGVTAMLLLGLVGASKERVVADYCYSFASEREVDRYVYDRIRDGARQELKLRYEAIDTVYDRLISGYGSIPSYLESCGVTGAELDRVRRHLCTPQL